MSKNKLYLDSCVFLNVWFDELVSEGRTFVASKRILEEIIDCTYNLVTSQLTLIELAKKMETTIEVILDYYLKPFKIIGKLEVIKINKKVAEEAVYFSSIYGIHKTDALHGMLAKTYECMLVTRDKELYDAAKKFSVEVKYPEELIP